MRLTEEDGHVSVFRSPSGYSNGNTFDFEGRQLSCEHAGRRVVRYEHDGSVTVIADKYNGKPLNSPNDVVVHPDGGIWFTDPPYGIMGSYEGFPAEAGEQGGGLPRGPEDVAHRSGDRRARQAQRHLLFARLQEAVRRGHGRAAEYTGLRRGREQAERRASVFTT